MRAQSLSCVWLCNPVDCSPSGSSVRELLQARILEWVLLQYCFLAPSLLPWRSAISFSRGLPNPGMEPTSAASPALAGGFLTNWSNREALSLLPEPRWSWCHLCDEEDFTGRGRGRRTDTEPERRRAIWGVWHYRNQCRYQNRSYSVCDGLRANFPIHIYLSLKI